jgi:hypothetical protein
MCVKPDIIVAGLPHDMMVQGSQDADPVMHHEVGQRLPVSKSESQ